MLKKFLMILKNKKINLICLLLVMSTMLYAQSSMKLINKDIANSVFKNALVGLKAINLNTQKTLVEFNSEKNFTPASVLKLVSTSTALELFGKNETFKTKLIIEGSINNGVLDGNILIKGFGDCTLGSKYFYQKKDSILWDMVKTLKLKGIKSIKGKIKTNNNAYSKSIPVKWSWEDIGNYYCALPDALSYYDNTYTLFLNSGKYDGSKTTINKIIPNIKNIEFINKVKSSNINRDLAYIYGSRLSNKRIIKGTIPKNRINFKVKGSIPNPSMVLKDKLYIILEKSGIQLLNQNISKTTSTLIKTYHSPKLSEIIKVTNQESNNLFAENFVNYISYKLKGNGSTDDGLKKIKKFWTDKNLDINSVNIYDGSGISQANSINANFIVKLLKYMKESKNFFTFYNSLAIAGKKGSLKYRFKNSILKNRIFAKTGSFTGVVCLAGYLKNKKNETIAFAFFINNFSGKSNIIYKQMDKIMEHFY